ncbi:MAG: dockerin type I repeat-containing protein, partial [Planctomycetes bacterium]|nr:dockerin type I repeat-containing protein [Planctomycetota bacterium]
GITAEIPPSDLAAPDYLDIRNANAAHTEIQLGLLKRVAGVWSLDLVNPPIISDEVTTPTLDRRADGRASVAADLAAAQAMVAWVRYTGDYLIQDGFVDRYLPSTGGCSSPICLFPSVPNFRPQMESTSIAVRRVDENGTLPGQDAVTISDAGINIQPSIAIAPGGSTAYCAWVHDPIHTDLIGSNRDRFLKYAVYDKATDTWSPPMDVLPNPDDFPALLEPTIALKGDHTGILAFTALPIGAPLDDTGLGGGSRLVYACRLIDGTFTEPVLIHGRCEARQYGWSQSLTLNVPTLVDPLTNLHTRLPEWVMTFQDYGTVGLPQGSGNVVVSFLDESTEKWSPAVSLMPEGTVMTNVVASVVGGFHHSVHYSAGPAHVGLALAGPAPVGYQIHETALEPDMAIVRCELDQPFSAPGSMVTATIQVENQGFASTPFDGGTSVSAIGLELLFVDDDATSTVVQSLPLPVLRPAESHTVQTTIEMPHRPVRLVVRVSPDPIDRDRSNDERECFFGAPAPRELSCAVIENVLESGASELGVRLSWTNPAIYDGLLIYRDGSMIHALPGGCERFTDLEASEGLHEYAIRGVIAASKSVRASLVCDLTPIPAIGFLRGDTNADGEVEISDVIYALSYQFIGGDPPPCFATADSNFDGEIDIADVITTLAYLFQGGAPLAAPFPQCGASTAPSDVALGCTEPGC